MGTCVACSYANIFMIHLEKKLLRNAPHQPALYLRYINDIFLIFKGSSETEPTEFHRPYELPTQNNQVHSRVVQRKGTLPRHLGYQKP